ncbi:MAG TPA: glycosyltransferase family 2 protein [Caulobacteraceae bacterium]|nr:glycosyltransferase family 2 protein [Caulobacteraceae bacterium]
MAVGNELDDGESTPVAFPASARRKAALKIAPDPASAAPLEAPSPALSIVAPCYNEQETLDAFCARMLTAAREACEADFELILVNDGSRDGTWALIEAQARACPNVVGVNLARNHGHQLAVTAGLGLARGQRVMIIDADLQDPPELLSQMMRRMDEGCDVVYGRRRERARESRFKLASASVFYRLLRVIAEVDIPQDTGDFRLMSRRIVERLNAMPEQDRFLRGMIAWLGGKQVELLYDRAPRHAGATHYTLAKMLRLALDGLTSFSTAPLRLAGLLSLFGVLVAFALAIYAVVGFALGQATPGWTSLALILVFFSTAQLLCLTIVGEYLGRIYMQGKRRPLYLVDEIVTHYPSDNEPGA